MTSTCAFTGTVNGPVIREKSLYDAYSLLKKKIVSKSLIIQVIMETVPVRFICKTFGQFGFQCFYIIRVKIFIKYCIVFLAEVFCWCGFNHNVR